MYVSNHTLRLVPRVWVAVLLACGVAALAHADDGGDTIGVPSSVTLPPQAKGNPPSWAGKAFRQGVVAVANPYGAEAGAQILEQGGNSDRDVDSIAELRRELNLPQPEAIEPDGAGWVVGVQWHPEWRHAENAVSRAIFAAFGEAVHRAARNRIALAAEATA